MHSAEYDGKTLVELGAAEIVDGLRGPLATSLTSTTS